ncbi:MULTISPECIES: hypothetical protein [unclassified Streptomyces]|uniref:hypothetical protein n=1 Tax=unclassified Streptomyces TaxID=2593676 RepID=UPI00224FAEA1|nr:hypothetical protein [Streptomyces sp. NBC_01551]MCX4524610.1 hypothetical protein [Streptomyces sp. NBC_01551]
MSTQRNSDGSRSARRRLVLGVGAALLVGAAVTGAATLASASSDGSSKATPTWPEAQPKSRQPMNINPEKTPELAPPKGGVHKEAPLTEAQKLAEANALAAKHPGEAVVCFNPDGTVSGVAMADLADPAKGLTEAAKKSLCDRPKAIGGSR